mmetsp:Transcript_48822/g.73773  ORF Transcript_48822/g.73773 Transcript_48822/m.73773 type:complete len:141 (+) Transcript_48822:649-1071(+)
MYRLPWYHYCRSSFVLQNNRVFERQTIRHPLLHLLLLLILVAKMSILLLHCDTSLQMEAMFLGGGRIGYSLAERRGIPAFFLVNERSNYYEKNEKEQHPHLRAYARVGVKRSYFSRTASKHLSYIRGRGLRWGVAVRARE